MGLIIKDKLPMFKKGYPTVSDKYNVAGGVLAGSTPVEFGDLVIKTGQTANGNYFAAKGTTFTIANVGGFVVATNVKVAEDFPGTKVQVNPGEAFNLLVNGFIAIELAANIETNVSNITAGQQVAVFLSGAQAGQITYTGATSTDTSAVTATDLPNVVFTGLYEKHADGKYYAEIYVK